MMSLPKKRKSLADNISFLLASENTSVDPEDDIYEETKAKVIEDDPNEDEGYAPSSSSLRKSNIDLLESTDQKYRGGVVSRKTLEDDSIMDIEDEGTSFSDESNASPELIRKNKRRKIRAINADEDDESNLSHTDENIDEESLEEGSEEDEESGNSMEDDNEYSDTESENDDSNDTNFHHMSGKDVNQEILKGNAVRNQLGIWDGLLECRIQLQKILMLSNQLPQYSSYGKFRSKGGTEFESSTSRATTKLSHCLDSLLELQNTLLKSFPETQDLKEPNLNASDSSEDDMLGSDEDVKQKCCLKEETNTEKKQRKLPYSEVLNALHMDYTPYRNATIEKWNIKTQVASGTSKRDFGAFEQSTLKQIERILADRSRVIRRTQLNRLASRTLGKMQSNRDADHALGELKNEDISKIETGCGIEVTQEYDPEIFDDSDFYHQLLRDLIEKRSADITDPVQLGRQWIQLQKMRNRMKRKVDVKATKGRRLRYGVHSKLVNYMAPQPLCSMNEEAKSELYNSLFGKMKT